jgi:hypothetical protein
MERLSVVPHGKDEVLVTFLVDNEPRNVLLREVTELNQKYQVVTNTFVDKQNAALDKLSKAKAACEVEIKTAQDEADVARTKLNIEAFEAAEAELTSKAEA